MSEAVQYMELRGSRAVIHLRRFEGMLTQRQRETLERLLLREREQALALLGSFNEDRAQSLEERAGELSTYRFHPADVGTEAMEQEKEFLLASREGRRLIELDEALRKLYKDPDQFGRCERCGEWIEFERLEIVPEARHCMRCQTALEDGRPAME
jgi:DnaK suppressor protein